MLLQPSSAGPLRREIGDAKIRPTFAARSAHSGDPFSKKTSNYVISTLTATAYQIDDCEFVNVNFG